MPAENCSKLCPVQQKAYDWFLGAAEVGNVLHCWCRTGRGRSTVLAQLHRTLGGVFLGIQDFVDATRDFHPLALEDALYNVVFQALRENNCVVVDDFHVATSTMKNCHFYPRSGYLDSPMTVLGAYAVESGKKLILDQHVRISPPPLNGVDVDRIVASTDGFTGADLKRTVEDGKALYAFDRVSGSVREDLTSYYQLAADAVRSSKERYADGALRANAAHPSRPAWFNPYSYSEYFESDDDD